jgi:hypothetical protein
MLRGPHHPENFRQQIGRYGDRHYVDNLPADALWTPSAPQNPLPSVSVIKQAFPKFLTDWAASAAAEYAVEHEAAWRQLPPADAIALISRSAVRQRDRAAKRGSDVHTIIENLAMGIHPDYMLIDDSVQPYVPCIEQMVRDLRLVPHISEAVVFNHDVGYGGTFDFIGATVHGVGLLDWKTRAKTSRYPEEAAQVAAYAGGEYMIVESEDHGAVRMEIPALDYLGVVVISPEGYQVHEVNETAAWNLWTSLVKFWQVKDNGGPFYEGTLATPISMPAPNKDNLIERVRSLPQPAREYLARQWPAGLPTLKQNPQPYDLLRIERLVGDVETRASAPFNPPPLPDEGGSLDHETWKMIDDTYQTLDDHIKQAVDYCLHSIVPSVMMGSFGRTVRRFEILRLIMFLAELCDGDVGRMGEHTNMATLGHITKEEASQQANAITEELLQRNHDNAS